MKQLTLLLAIILGGFLSAASAQSQKTVRSEVRPDGSSRAENYAEIKFDTLRIDLGKFPSSEPTRKCSFRFRNVGTAPLLINQAFPSCGCTVPSFTKEEIKPGETGTIDITYNGKGLPTGPFSKTISVRTNAKNKVSRLVITGEMTD